MNTILWLICLECDQNPIKTKSTNVYQICIETVDKTRNKANVWWNKSHYKWTDRFNDVLWWFWQQIPYELQQLLSHFQLQKWLFCWNRSFVAFFSLHNTLNLPKKNMIRKSQLWTKINAHSTHLRRPNSITHSIFL